MRAGPWRSIGLHVRALLEMQKAGAVAFEYGNNLRAQAVEAGVADAFRIPGFIPEYIRPCSVRARDRSAGWPCPANRRTSTAPTRPSSPRSRRMRDWRDGFGWRGTRWRFQGLPARICWLGYGARAKLGLRFNEMVRRGELKGPIVIGRDHLDAGSVASPHRETEAMKDGSDAIADWPILNALLNTACGAGWVSVHHGGGVGIGSSLHAGMVVVADGSDDAERRLGMVLTSDPAMGVLRHADAGYEEAVRCAEERDVRVPGLNY